MVNDLMLKKRQLHRVLGESNEDTRASSTLLIVCTFSCPSYIIVYHSDTKLADLVVLEQWLPPPHSRRVLPIPSTVTVEASITTETRLPSRG